MARAMDWSRARRPRETEAASPEPEHIRPKLNRRNRTRWGRRLSKDELRQAGATALAEWEARKPAS